MAETVLRYPSGNRVVETNDVAWSNPSGAYQASGEATASNVPKNSGESNRHGWNTYGFTVSDLPDGSALDGVEVVITGYSSATASDYYVRLKYGSGAGTESPDKVMDVATSAGSTHTFGGSSDLWGLAALTPAAIRSNDFEVQVRARNESTSGSSTVRIQGIQVKVYYDSAGPHFPRPLAAQDYTSANLHSNVHDVTMPQEPVPADGWLLMFCATGANELAFELSIAETGWVKLGEVNQTELFERNVCCTVFAKKAVGTEGGTTVAVQVSPTTALTARMEARTIIGDRWTVPSGDASQSIEIGTFFTSQSTQNPDPPAVTASWGSAKNLFYAFGASARNNDTCWWDAAPANYTDLVSLNNSGHAVRIALGVAQRELEAASDDPGAFTLSNSGCAGIAATLVIRPEGGEPPEPTFQAAWARQSTIGDGYGHV